MRDKLNYIYNALNNLEVKGRNNCAIVAAVMNAIEEMYNECINQETSQEDGDSCGK